jgi:hypothetical protein
MTRKPHQDKRRHNQHKGSTIDNPGVMPVSHRPDTGAANAPATPNRPNIPATLLP